jgi:hypothetical protein
MGWDDDYLGELFSLYHSLHPSFIWKIFFLHSFSCIVSVSVSVCFVLRFFLLFEFLTKAGTIQFNTPSLLLPALPSALGIPIAINARILAAS